MSIKKWIAGATCACMLMTLSPPAAVMAAESPTQAVDAAAPSAMNMVWTDGSTIDISGNQVLDSRVDVEGTVILTINEGATLTIKGGIHNGPNSKLILQGKGSLVIDEVPDYCAGIGGNQSESGGTIEVNDVDLKVQGGIGAAGLGGGHSGSGGTITIKSGKVNATGGHKNIHGSVISGAGIGGGYYGSGGNIVIEGGTVTATGGNHSAGIGGGSVGEGGHITITGGTIEAHGGESAAAIGGGICNHCGVVHIKGGVIKANGNSGPGIGNGHMQKKAPGTIIIDGGDITAVVTGHSTASGIGSCYDDEGGTITINGGNITAKGNEEGAGIGGGYDRNGWDIIITGGNIEAEGRIGIGSYNEYTSTPLNKKIIISGGRVKATGQYGIGAEGHGVFSTTANGNALIETSNIGAQTNRDEWNGIIYIKDERISQVYGKRLVLNGKYQLPSGKTLTIPKGTVLDIPEGSQLVPGLNAAFHNQGIVNLYGDWNPHIRGDVRIPSTMSMALEFPQDTMFGSNVAVMVSIAGKAYPQLKGTGEVLFFVGEGEQKQSLGSATLSDGMATFNLDAAAWKKLAIGNNVIEASYSGMKDQVGAAGLIENKATMPLNVIKAEQNPPAAPVVASKTTTSVTLKEIAPQNDAAAEYSKDGGQTWQASPVFEGLTAGTEYSFVARFAETAHYKASAASEAVKAHTESLPIAPSKPSYPPTVPEADGGDVAVGPARPNEGDTVTVTPKPKEGMVVDKIIVTDKDGNKIEVTQKPNGEYTFKQPSGKVTITVTFKPEREEGPSGDLPFTDVPQGAWYEDAVRYVYENGLIMGVSANEFAPNATTDRAQLVTMLWRLAGEPQAENSTGFSDVPSSAYYAKAVAWAAENGITAGFEDGSFRPTTGLSREQMAALFMKLAAYSGLDTTARADLGAYTDVNKDGWSIDALSWAKAVGLLNGVADATMAPQDTATRAQIAAVLQRYCETVAK